MQTEIPETKSCWLDSNSAFKWPRFEQASLGACVPSLDGHRAPIADHGWITPLARLVGRSLPDACVRPC